MKLQYRLPPGFDVLDDFDGDFDGWKRVVQSTHRLLIKRGIKPLIYNDKKDSFSTLYNNRLYPFSERSIERLYRRFVVPHWKCDGDFSYNEFRKRAVLTLYHITTPDRVLLLILMYTTQFCPICWFDPDEIETDLNSFAQSFRRSLIQKEKKRYDSYDTLKQAAFRACRRLALGKKPRKPTNDKFFMSCHQLALRLGILDNTAYRILQQFRKDRVIRRIRRGDLRSRRASEFEWIMSPVKCRSYTSSWNGSQTSGNGSKTRFKEENVEEEPEESFEQQVLRLYGRAVAEKLAQTS
jgi:hypothetical protein